MSQHHAAAPIRKPLFTPGVFVLLGLMTVGAIFAAIRFIYGIGAITNLDNQYPWGIWIAVDVASGVALAAGGFTTAAMVEIFGRQRYHGLLRPALLTAMLGYTFVALGIMVDLGRYYNIWHPLLPSMWSGHSVLFEVAICVMCYLTVLYIEFIPIVVERFKDRVNMPGLLRPFNRFVEFMLWLFDRTLGRVMFLFIIAGVLLSCLHQSSLGALMVIVPSKLHPLWHTPVLPLLFLLSALSVGFPMVIVESLWAAKSFGEPPEMKVLGPLSRAIPVILTIYLAFKIGDMAIRDTHTYLLDGSLEAVMFICEVLLGVILPLVMLFFEKVRRSPGWLFTASLLVVLGVMLNRINVFLVAYYPVYRAERYFPSIGEIAVTVGLMSALIFIYRVMVTIFPVIPKQEAATSEPASPPEGLR